MSLIVHSQCYAYTYQVDNQTNINPKTGKPFRDPVSGEFDLDPDTKKPYINPWTNQPDVGIDIRVTVPLAATGKQLWNVNPIKPGQKFKIESGRTYGGFCLKNWVKVEPMCNGQKILQRGIRGNLIFDTNGKTTTYFYTPHFNPLGKAFWGMMGYATGGATDIARISAQIANAKKGISLDTLQLMSQSEGTAQTALKAAVEQLQATKDPKKLESWLNDQVKNFQKQLKDVQNDLKNQAKKGADTSQDQQTIDSLNSSINQIQKEATIIKQNPSGAAATIVSIKDSAIHSGVLAVRALRIAQGKGLPTVFGLSEPVTDQERAIVMAVMNVSENKAIQQIENQYDALVTQVAPHPVASRDYTCHFPDVPKIEAQAQCIIYALKIMQSITNLKYMEKAEKDPSQFPYSNIEQITNTMKSTANNLTKLLKNNPTLNGTIPSNMTPSGLTTAATLIYTGSRYKSSSRNQWVALANIQNTQKVAEEWAIYAARAIMSLDEKPLPKDMTITSPLTAAERDAVRSSLNLPNDQAIFYLTNTIRQEAETGNTSGLAALAEPATTTDQHINTTKDALELSEKVGSFAANLHAVMKLAKAGAKSLSHQNQDPLKESYELTKEIKSVTSASKKVVNTILLAVKLLPKSDASTPSSVTTAIKGGANTIIEMVPDKIRELASSAKTEVTALTDQVKTLVGQAMSRVEQLAAKVVGKVGAKAASEATKAAIKSAVTKAIQTALKEAEQEAKNAGQELSEDAAKEAVQKAVANVAQSTKSTIIKITNNPTTAEKITSSLIDAAEKGSQSITKTAGQDIAETAAKAVGESVGEAVSRTAGELGAELAVGMAVRAAEFATGPVGIIVQLGSMVAIGLAGAFCAAADYCGDKPMVVTRKGDMDFNVFVQGKC